MSEQMNVMTEGSTPMTTITGTNCQFSVPTNPLIKNKNAMPTSSFWRLVCYEIYNTGTIPISSVATSTQYGVSYSDAGDIAHDDIINRVYPDETTPAWDSNLSNLTKTKSYQLRAYDEENATGQELTVISSGLATNDYFVLIYADDVDLHHMAKITSISAVDETSTVYSLIDFDPPLKTDIPKDIKFSIWKGPLVTRTDCVAVAYGLLNSDTTYDTSASGSDDLTKSKHIEFAYVAKPNFFFYNDRLNKNNELNHDTKYILRRSILRDDTPATSYDRVQIHDVSVFSTKPEYGTFIFDSGNFNHHGELKDRLRVSDEVSLTVSSEAMTQDNVTAYRRYIDDDENDTTPFGLSGYVVSYTVDTTDWIDSILNIYRSRDGTKTATLGNGPTRYLHYDDSPIKNTIIPRVIDIQLASSITSAGSYANITIADMQNIMGKKIHRNDPIHIKRPIASGDIQHQELSPLFGTITAASSDTLIVFDGLEEGQDLRTVLSFGSAFETIKIENYRYRITAIGAPSGGAQQVTISHYRGVANSSFQSGGIQETLTEVIAHRRTWSKLTSTLMVGFPIDTEITYDSLPLSADIVIGTDTLSYNGEALTAFTESRINGLELILLGDHSFFGHRIKIKYGDSVNNYVKIQDIDRDFSPPSGLTTNNMVQAYQPVDVLTHQAAINFNDTSYKTPSLLDYFNGGFIVEKIVFKGRVETIDEKTEDGIHLFKITGRSDIAKLLGPVLNKNYTFSKDWVYSTIGPYFEIEDSACNTAEVVKIGDVSFDVNDGSKLTAGDILCDSVGKFHGIVSVVSSNTITLEDGNQEYAGSGNDIYKSKHNLYSTANPNHVLFGKSIQSNSTLTNTPTPLKSASDMGFFYSSGNKLSFKTTSSKLDSTEGAPLSATSASTDSRARGYYLDSIRDIGNIESGFSGQPRGKATHTINSLSHYTVVNIESGQGEATIELAPNCPAILARVDSNVKDMRFGKTTVYPDISGEVTRTNALIDAAGDLDGSQTYFDGSTYSAGHQNSITVDNINVSGYQALRKPLYKSDGTFIGRVWKVEGRLGVTTPTKYDILLDSKIPDGVSLENNEHLYSATTTYVHGMYFINSQGLNDGGMLQLVNSGLGYSRRPIPYNTHYSGADSGSATINANGTRSLYGPSTYRYVDLQRGGKGGLRRTNLDRLNAEPHLDFKVEAGNIHAYAPAYKAVEGFIGTTHNLREFGLGGGDAEMLVPSIEGRGVGPVYGSNTINEPIRNNNYQLMNQLAKKQHALSGTPTTIQGEIGPWGISGVTALETHQSKDLTGSSAIEQWRVGNLVEQYKNAIERLDPKGITYHIFAPADMWPESMSRPNHLGYAARDLTNYNLILHDSGAYANSNQLHEHYAGSLSSHEMTDDSFESVPITSSSITGDQIKRFGLMRLIELTFDWHFNVVDPELPPQCLDGETNVPSEGYTRTYAYTFLPLRKLDSLGLSSGNYKITAWVSSTVATVTKNDSTVTAAQIDTDFNDGATDAGWEYIFTNKGEFIGTVATDGAATSSTNNQITFTSHARFPYGSSSLYTGAIYCIRYTDDNDSVANAPFWGQRIRGVGQGDTLLGNASNSFANHNDITILKGAIFSGKYTGDTNYSAMNPDIDRSPTGHEIFNKPDNSVSITNAAYFSSNDNEIALLRLPPLFMGAVHNSGTGPAFQLLDNIFTPIDNATYSSISTQGNYSEGDGMHLSKVLYYLSQGRNIYRGLRGIVLDRYNIDSSNHEAGQVATGMTFPVSDALYLMLQASTRDLSIFLKMSSKKFEDNSTPDSEYPSTPFVQFANIDFPTNGTTNATINSTGTTNNVCDGAKVLFKPLLHLQPHAQGSMGVDIAAVTAGTGHIPNGHSVSANTGDYASITIEEVGQDATPADKCHDNAWLKFAPNLTGYYLVSTEGYKDGGSTLHSADTTRWPNASWANAGVASADAHFPALVSGEGIVPRHIMHILNHEVYQEESSGERKHIFIVDNVNTSSTYIANYYRVMKPAETCLWPKSPHDKIDLYKSSCHYTKRPYDDDMYSEVPQIMLWNGQNISGIRDSIGYEEAIQSMYVIVNMDPTSDDIHIVPRGVTAIASSPVLNYTSTIFGDVGSGKRFESNTSYDVLLNDGEHQERKQMSVYKSSTETMCRLDFGKPFEEKMAGIVSIGEIFTVTTPLSSTIQNPTKANIASTVSICPEAEDIVKDIMETQNIDYSTSAIEFPYFAGPNFVGVDAYNATTFAADFKDKRLVVTPDGIRLRASTENTDYSGIEISEESNKIKIMDITKEESEYDRYNEIIVYGQNVKSVRRLGSSIKKVGIKTLEEYDNTIRTQDEADKKALKLMQYHGLSTERIVLKAATTGLELMKVGDIITVDVPSKGVFRRQYMVLEIRHDSRGVMEFEVGAYFKGLTDRIAELAVKNKQTVAAVRASKFKPVGASVSFLDILNIREVKLTITKEADTGSPFTIGFNYAVNVASTSVGFNPALGSVDKEIILEENFV